MFEWVTEAADKVSDWMGGGEEQKKKAPAQGGGAAAGGGYDQQQQALSPQNNTYAQQQQAVAPVSGTVKGQGASASTNAAGGGGLSDWWSNLWGGGGGGEKEKEKSGGAAPETKAAKDPVAEQRAREDKYYQAKWRLDQMKENQSAYQRYVQRRDKWDSAYAKYKQDPYRNKMPDQIKPFTAPNPGVPDPTYPAWGGAFAEQQAKVEQLKGG